MKKLIVAAALAVTLFGLSYAIGVSVDAKSTSAHANCGTKNCEEN